VLDNVNKQIRVLQLLLYEAEKSCLTRKQLDRIDGHMAELRELTYRQVELVEKGNLKGQIVERAAKLLATLNDLIANYHASTKNKPAGLRVRRFWSISLFAGCSATSSVNHYLIWLTNILQS
jgi:hypothetical protein